MLWRKKGKLWTRAYILTGEHRITQLVPIRHSRDFLDKDDWIMIIGVHAKLSRHRRGNTKEYGAWVDTTLR